MKQFVISRCKRAWTTEYSVTNFVTEAIVFRAIHSQAWKNKIDAFGADGTLIYSMKSRDLFGLAYDITDAGNGKI